jgi:hypothetical protein
VKLAHAAFGLLAITALGGAAWSMQPAPEPIPAPSTPSQREQQAIAGALGVGQVLVGLATAPPAPKMTAPPADPAFGRKVAQAARAYLRHRPPWTFRDDCSGYVSAVFTAAGAPMDGRVQSIYELAVAHHALHWDHPRVGDLLFFDDTWDRDSNADYDDELTHIGVVIDVAPDGRATYANGGTSRGRTTGTIDIDRPWVHRDADGSMVNSYVREPAADDPPDAQYLAGELWVAFATVDPADDWLD